MVKKAQNQIENRRHIARAQKDALQQRRLMMALGGVGAVVLLILLAGLIFTYGVRPNQAIATVNGAKITRQTYEKRVLYERFILDEQITYLNLQYQQIAQSLQDDTTGLFDSLKAQAEQQLNEMYGERMNVDRSALDMLIEENLIVAEAAKRAITVSDEEVDKTYQDIAASRSGGVTETSAQSTVTARTNATATALLYTPTPVPTPAAGQTAPTPVPTTAPQPTPTINVVSGEAMTTAIATWEKTLRDEAHMTPADIRQLVYHTLLKQKVVEAIGNEVAATALQAQARHILVATKAEADAAKTRIEAGESFESVAAEISLDTSTAPDGGDLGWFPQGAMITAFDEAAFSQEVGKISDPIETQYGWHLIEVLAREDHELDQMGLNRAKSVAYSNWLTDATLANVEDFWKAGDAPADNSDFAKTQAASAPVALPTEAAQ